MKNQTKVRRYSNQEIQTVVDGIVNGKLLIKEAMAMYDIRSKQTVSKWLIKYLEENKTYNSAK